MAKVMMVGSLKGLTEEEIDEFDKAPCIILTAESLGELRLAGGKLYQQVDLVPRAPADASYEERVATHRWGRESVGTDRGKPIWPCTRCPAQKLSYLYFRADKDGAWQKQRIRCSGVGSEPSPTEKP